MFIKCLAEGMAYGMNTPKNFFSLQMSSYIRWLSYPVNPQELIYSKISKDGNLPIKLWTEPRCLKYM